MRADQPTRLFAATVWTAALVPPVLVAVWVARTAVDVPFSDQWDFPPLLLAVAQGHLDPHALWTQHNEHRIVVPRLLMLGLALATGWDVRWELATSIVLNLAALALLGAALVRAVRPSFPRLAPWLVLAASLLTFSLSQWENWALGWQMGLFFHLLTVAGIAALLADWDGGWRRLFGMLALAAVGLLCFAGGVSVLVLLPIAVACWPYAAPPRARVLRALVTGAACVTIAVLYVNGFEYPAHHPRPGRSLAYVRAYVAYVLAYLGGGFASWDRHTAVWSGSLGLALLVVAVGRLALLGPRYRRPMALALFLGAYALVNAMITGLGRAGFGVEQALSSRYVSISALLWVGVALAASLASASILADPEAPARPTSQRLILAAAIGAVLVPLAVGYCTSWELGRKKMKAHRRVLENGLTCLRRLDAAPARCLARLSPRPREELVQIAEALRDHGLGPLRKRSSPERPPHE